ncbi:MAG: ParA family protein [Gammaproteobacteria bacterium]|nr:ParA family protein [Gammaproteobacteria bacterium]
MIRKIVVINSKGGCGKTTLSTNLASYYASHGYPTALFDYDPQDSATRWLAQRPEDLTGIHGVAAAHPPEENITRSFQLRVPPGTQRLILDTPASLKRMELIEILRDAWAIIVPILPSTIDSCVTSDFLKDLDKELRLYAPDASIAIVANRVRRNTRAFQTLMKFLEDKGMPPVTCLRDSQNYVQASADGMGIHEMKANFTRVDREHWQSLIDWLEAEPLHSDAGTCDAENRSIA